MVPWAGGMVVKTHGHRAKLHDTRSLKPSLRCHAQPIAKRSCTRAWAAPAPTTRDACRTRRTLPHPRLPTTVL